MFFVILQNIKDSIANEEGYCCDCLCVCVCECLSVCICVNVGLCTR